jgi:hypothetical protein
MSFDDFVFRGSLSTNKCHRNGASAAAISSPGAGSAATTTTNLRRNKEMKSRAKTTTCCSADRTGPACRPQTRKSGAAASRLVLVLCLLCPVLADPSAEPTLQQQQGGLLPFPEGKFLSIFEDTTLLPTNLKNALSLLPVRARVARFFFF